MISVIISVFNQASTLRWLLESLAPQECSEKWEVLVCDDGSDPATMEIVRDFVAQTDIDLRHLWQPDRGFRAARSRNNGIRSAQGDLLIFLDGDMVVRPGFLDAHRRAHERELLLACGTRYSIRIGSGIDGTRHISEFRRRQHDHLQPEQLRQLSWRDTPFPWMTLLSCNFSVRKRPEVIFDERFVGWGTEDREFSLRLCERFCYSAHVISGADAVHVLPSDPFNDCNPMRTNHHDHIVSLLRNKLYFRHLYPDLDLRPGLELLLSCFLDPRTDQWYMAPPLESRDLAAVLRTVEDWISRHNLAICSERPLSSD